MEHSSAIISDRPEIDTQCVTTDQDLPPIKWSLVYNDDMEAGCISEIYDCYNIQAEHSVSAHIGTSKKKLYVIKILTRKDSLDVLNLRTIELQSELGKLGIMPEIIDQGIHPANKGDPITFKRRFFVMTKYMINGFDYLKMLISSRKKQTVITLLIRKYYIAIFDLYRKLATSGICSFDAKNKNIVLNYDDIGGTMEITDIRIIDIEYSFTKVYYSDLDHLIISQYFVAMILMHYLTDNFTNNKTYPIYDCYKNIIYKIDFDYLIDLRFDLIKDCAEYKTGTYIGLFYCYYDICYGSNSINLIEFAQTKNKIELFTGVLSDILKSFPFYSKCP